MFNSILQVLLNALLSNHLRNPHLRINIERVRIQVRNVLLPPVLLLSLLVLHPLQRPRKQLRILNHACQLRSLANSLCSHLRIAHQLQPDHLRIWDPAARLRRLLACRLWCRSSSSVADV